MNFQEIRRSRTTSAPCPVCGKRTRRTLTEWQTVSPFNLNEDGSVRTADEVARAVDEKLAKMTADHRHQGCAVQPDGGV